MRIDFEPGCLLRAAVFVFASLFLPTLTLAQSQAIQPCEATPSPAKPVQPLTAPAKVDARQTEINATISSDAGVEKILGPYSAKVRALDVVIGNLASELSTNGIGANTMGQFVADAIMTTAKAKLGPNIAVAITNRGGLRKNAIKPGELRGTDIFELLPFENELIEVKLTGAQLLTLLQRLTTARDAQSGARIHFRWNEQDRPEFISAKLVDTQGQERDIDPAANYTVVTIDYLLNLESGNYAILRDARNTRPLNLKIRDAVIDYVKKETTAGRPIRSQLDGRFVQVGPGPARPQDRSND